MSGLTSATEESSALRQLCEIVYQPTNARRDALLAIDWSAYPRVARSLASLQEPITPIALSDRARQLIEDAVNELDPRFPVLPDAITPVEVVRWHILENRSWLSITAMLNEEGRPHSRGTLIRRQHEFLPYLEQWAANGEAAEEPGAEVEEPEPREHNTAYRRLLLPVLVVAIAAAVFMATRKDPATAHAAWRDLRSYVTVENRVLAPNQWTATQRSLGIEPTRMPRLGFKPIDFQILPRAEGLRPRALIFAHYASEHPGALALADFVSGTTLWESEFVPPRNEILTHATLDSTVLYDPFRASCAFFDPRHADRIVVSYYNRFSPCFAVQFDLESGKVLSWYTYPGRLETGFALDLDEDGTTEYILAGQDNVYNRPTVVVLHPTDTNGAASDVLWNDDGEGAVVRTLLPPVRELEAALYVPRLRPSWMSTLSWSPSTGALTVRVVADHDKNVYTAVLDRNLKLTELFVGDSAMKTWRPTGLDASIVTALADSAIVIHHGDRQSPTAPGRR